jgi:radical SAM protein with 4Fe4S-binding SPASM domain
MRQTYKQQNDELLQNMMEKTYFASWKLNWKRIVDKDPEAAKKWKENDIFYGNYLSLEFQLNQHCDLDCLYCYEQRYGDIYFPGKTSDKKIVAHNVDLMLDFLYENKMYPRIEIFSGDPLVQTIGHTVIDKIITAAENGRQITSDISVPTNMSMLLYPNRRKSIEDLIERGRKVGIRISLSASVDGAFMEENRPFKRKDKVRDAKYYDDLFRFAKKYSMGFHPMIYSHNMKNWKKNFMWFQKMFQKYDIPWTSLYLLEIRNIEWTDDDLYELYDFMRWLVHWTFNKLGRNPFAYGTGGQYFNILASGFNTNGRGIGCSIQSSLQLRMGDFSWAMCHRLMYDKLNVGKFEVVDDKLTGKFDSANIEAHIGLQSADTLSFPKCETCMLKHLCNAGCLGSNFESTGDPYTTHPSVCQVEHYKILGILQGLADNKLLGHVLSLVSDPKRISINELLRTGLVKYNETYNFTENV